ncbi:ABC transporter permease [Prescottella agglutinans]|uniref:ABC-type dipeptide/oligopeptide/nickel transport system permease subunit n=1 Tax=Prescottella agglutinans TaxID=1644129 RepID=A0ABT6MKE7_9NOCA|nr:ABC transporter permease [Prescottella agglutinans]MDH6284271.1 ABC-type dipeptide/oligopeptide/nickel transport system permease subunit [Prescottella agglutinans]
MRSVLRGRAFVWSLAVLAVIVVYALVVPMVAGGDPRLTDFAAAYQPPSTAHWFGTDSAGRDLFVRTAAGLRVSLAIAAICAIASTVLGLAVGVAAGALGGRTDQIVMRLVDGINALPHLLLGIVIVALYPGNLAAIIASIALTHWTQVARIARTEVRAARGAPYVEAARLSGATRTRVTVTHLVPAAAGQALVAVVLLLPHAIWHESTLSFLGLGLPPDRASLGTLLQDSRAAVLTGAWWSLAFPALALVVTTLAVAGLGAALRDRITPPMPERTVR